MSCPDCPSGVEVGTATFKNYVEPDLNGNEIYNIPLKVGEPLSSACQRANTIGRIPEILHYPGFVVSGGKIPAKKASNAGISEGGMKMFFSRRSSDLGCFGDVPLYGSTCES